MSAKAFTANQRDQHLEDARQYGQLADVVEQRLRSTTIDGDRFMAEQRRARKVAGKLRKMERASKKAAGAAEALYAAYVNEVLELPGRRAAAEAKRLERQDRRAQRKQVTAGQTAAWAAKYASARPAVTRSRSAVSWASSIISPSSFSCVTPRSSIHRRMSAAL